MEEVGVPTRVVSWVGNKAQGGLGGAWTVCPLQGGWGVSVFSVNWRVRHIRAEGRELLREEV